MFFRELTVEINLSELGGCVQGASLLRRSRGRHLMQKSGRWISIIPFLELHYSKADFGFIMKCGNDTPDGQRNYTTSRTNREQ